MKRKTLPLLALVATTLFLSACDDRSDELKAISKFKDLTPPRFSDVVSHQDDVSEEWSQVDYLSGPTLQVLRTRQSPDGCGWQLLLPRGYAGKNRPATDECAVYCR
jgi:hypothetical protein